MSIPNSKFVLAALLLFATTACIEREAKPSQTSLSSPQADAGGAAAESGVAVVLETMDAGSYTYAQIQFNGQPTWFAGMKLPLAKGDRIQTPSEPMAMHDFESATLGRTFELIYFVNSFTRVGGSNGGDAEAADLAHAAAQGHAAMRDGAEDAGVEVGSVETVEGGQTVAGLFELGKAAAGQEVEFRGRVVKFNANILGKNWLHVQDGTGAAGTDDITVTTDANVKVGDLVLVRGKLAADRDFGAGYIYELLVEDAAVTVE